MNNNIESKNKGGTVQVAIKKNKKTIANVMLRSPFPKYTCYALQLGEKIPYGGYVKEKFKRPIE